MGWAGDDIFPRAGVYELFNANGISLGILATWYESVPGMKYVNEWRVHVMPLEDSVSIQRTADYAHGSVNGDTIAQRRQRFQEIWDAYRDAHPEILNNPLWRPETPDVPGLVDREWIGTMQDGQGFNLHSASSATAYGGPPPGNRGQEEQRHQRMEDNMANEPGTQVWKLMDTNGEGFGELIVAWSSRDGDFDSPDWTRELTAWRIAPFLPGEFGLIKERIDEDMNVDGATAYVRSAQANEIWNAYVLVNGVQPGTTAAEFRGSLGPIQGFSYESREEAE
jgi:hypothetical protein